MGFRKVLAVNPAGRKWQSMQRVWDYHLLHILALVLLAMVICYIDISGNLLSVRRISKTTLGPIELHADSSTSGVLANATVLITGAAGFIGYSVASYILQHELGKVIGIDNFNNDYDVGLKYRRSDRLSHWRSMHLIEGDICDSALVRNILQQHNVTHVLHLAAQTGMPKHLHAYVPDKMSCFATLFEELHELKANLSGRPFPRFIYASSLSTYGGNIDILSGNAYDSNKWINELLASMYFVDFGIASIGLRFSTVYGPWGRPDTTPFHFTENIEQEKNITVYDQGTTEKGFIYIDDIVSGIIFAMTHPASSAAKMDLGNGNSENKLDLVKVIEQRLGRRARMNYERPEVKPPLRGAAKMTKADKVIPFNPKVRLEEGMRSFIDWYLAYYGVRSLCASECADPKWCIPSFFDAVLRESVTMTNQCNIVVYTIYIGERNVTLYNPLHEEAVDEPTTCYVAFVAKGRLITQPGSLWKMVPVEIAHSLPWDERQLSRVIKLTPASFFAESVTHAIYVDASIQLVAQPQKLVDMLVHDDGEHPRQAIMMAARHPVRFDPFAEARVIEHSKKFRNEISYSIRTMNHQISIYKQGEQDHNMSLSNLISGGLLVHDIKSASGRGLRCAWSKEYYAGADRDQVSLPWVLTMAAKTAGATLAPEEEWCKIDSAPDGYLRILPSHFLTFHNISAIAIAEKKTILTS
jgi:UDP-glucuronate 4-epimerase